MSAWAIQRRRRLRGELARLVVSQDAADLAEDMRAAEPQREQQRVIKADRQRVRRRLWKGTREQKYRVLHAKLLRMLSLLPKRIPPWLLTANSKMDSKTSPSLTLTTILPVFAQHGFYQPAGRLLQLRHRPPARQPRLHNYGNNISLPMLSHVSFANPSTPIILLRPLHQVRLPIRHYHNRYNTTRHGIRQGLHLLLFHHHHFSP
jgi:hypothetical protein